MPIDKVITVPGRDALAELDRLRAESARTGLFPFILGDPEEMDGIEENMEEDFDPDVTLGKAHAIDLPAWFRDKTAVMYEADLLTRDEIGQWPGPGEVTPTGLVTHLDYRGKKPLPQVSIGLLRLNAAWEVFATLNWGGWNDCPFAEDHCAIHRYWQERYGAEVVSVTRAIVQCVVKRPPRDRDSSMALAYEQYLYCCDIVVQGTETIANLAATLIDAEHWYFWWD